jgi:hypothetical protein
MRIVVTILCALFWMVAVSKVNADTSPAIAVGNAKTIVELRDKVDAAKEALKNALPDSDKARLSNNLKNAQEELDGAVQSVYLGKPAEGVDRAEKILQQQKQVDDVRAMLSKSGLSASEKSALEHALKALLDNLIKSTTDVSETKELKDLADKRFAGFNFGVALGVVIKAGKRDIVQSASLDANGIVRIDRDNNTTANMILETHYFFTPDCKFINVEPKNWGIGPFIAVQPGTQNIIESAGAGLMIGFKRSSIIAKDLARDRGDSFNIGLGVMVNPNAQVLGDGVQKNQILPTGETTVRLRTTTEMGYLVTFSYSF